jgi:hypothetical protein
MNAEFQSLKRKYLEQLAQIEANAVAVRNKLSVLEELEGEQRQLKLNVDSTKYAGKGLTESVLAAFSQFNGSGVTASDLRKHLLAHGFKPIGKNLSTSIYITLNRLNKKGHIESLPERDGQRVFKKKA